MLDVLLPLKNVQMVAIHPKDAQLPVEMVVNLHLLVVKQSPQNVQTVLYLTPPDVHNYVRIILSPM